MMISDSIRGYWDLRSRGFSEAVMYELKNNDRRLSEHLGALCEGRTPLDILDVGCGPGIYSLYFGKMGYNVTGIDFSPKMIEQARRNAESEGVRAKFIVMDAQEIDLPDESFDLVVSRDMFWALEHPDRAYSEIMRVLRHGGTGMVSDGNYYRHLFDDRYAEHRRKMAAQYRAAQEKDKDLEGGHFKFNTDHVDFKIIEDLAHDIPLSRVDRPEWDVGTLCRIGCDNVSVRIRHAGAPEGESGRLIMSFDVLFRKD